MLKKIKKKVLIWLGTSYKRRKQRNLRLDINYCLKAIRLIIFRQKYGFLISNSGNGWASTRLVQPIVGSGFVIWIGTDPRLRKVAEIRQDPKVTFAYQDAKQNANLIIYGHASIESNTELKKKYWKSEWRLFFPGGPISEEYILIRIEPVRIELLSFARNIVPEPFGLQPVVLEKVNGDWAVVGEYS